MVNRDVIIAKIDNIQRSLDRLKGKQGVTVENFSNDRDIQDIALLNLQVTIQGCIDIASHIISDNNWGVPGSLGGLFDTLCEKKVITCKTKETMRSMVGFRNLIVHEYVRLDISRVYAVFSGQLGDFAEFLKEIALYTKLY